MILWRGRDSPSSACCAEPRRSRRAPARPGRPRCGHCQQGPRARLLHSHTPRRLAHAGPDRSAPLLPDARLLTVAASFAGSKTSGKGALTPGWVFRSARARQGGGGTGEGGSQARCSKGEAEEKQQTINIAGWQEADTFRGRFPTRTPRAPRPALTLVDVRAGGDLSGADDDGPALGRDLGRGGTDRLAGEHRGSHRLGGWVVGVCGAEE